MKCFHRILIETFVPPKTKGSSVPALRHFDYNFAEDNVKLCLWLNPQTSEAIKTIQRDIHRSEPLRDLGLIKRNHSTERFYSLASKLRYFKV